MYERAVELFAHVQEILYFTWHPTLADQGKPAGEREKERAPKLKVA